MTSRSVRPKVLRHLRRHKSGARHSATATSTSAPILPLKAAPRGPDPDPKPKPSTPVDAGLDFTDSKRIFSSLSTRKLLKSLLTLQVVSLGPTAEIGSRIMRSKLMDDPLSRSAVVAFTELTFFDHFCAGKDLAAANTTVRNLWESGLTAMLDYGLEHANDNQACDTNLNEFIHTIDSTKFRDDCPVSFVVVKITAICPPRLLRRVSDLLRWEYKDSSFKLPWKLQSFPVLSDSSPFYHTLKKPEPLTPQEEHDLELAYDRMYAICNSSLAAGIPLLIDAEDSSIQPAIDYFTYSTAVKYDSYLDHNRPLMFNTIQCYLKDSQARLVAAKQAADVLGVPLGFKLVRGAYLTTENRLAASLGVDSPIHDSIHRTHQCYNKCTEFMLEEVSKGFGSVVLATHNMDSGKFAATKAVNLGIEKNSHCLHFAQLYGMAEALSYGLRNGGFRVSKYLPFGPVEHIMPYLLRRAEENKGLLSASVLDRQLMRKELIRRLTSPGS